MAEAEGNFLKSRKKNTIDILKRFRMLDCKSVATPMDENLKKLPYSALDSNLIHPISTWFRPVPNFEGACR